MTTNEKLKLYETALKDWEWKIKAVNSNPLLKRLPLEEPKIETYNIKEPLEVWCAAKIRSQLVNTSAAAPLASSS